MLELEEALARILQAVSPPVPEVVSLRDAHGRIAAEAIKARIDLPLFHNSSVDGYAVRAADTHGANSAAPATLKLCGRVAAGDNATGTVGSGECFRIFTGSPLPQGADAVVMQEDTRKAAGESREIQVLDSVQAGENVRWRGEDIASGRVLVEAGQGISAPDLALLGAAGVKEINAGRQPIVGLLTTGSELKEPGEQLAPGQIYESNRLPLEVLVRQAGGIPKVWPIVPDDLDATRQALREAFDQCQIVITCGGASVGEADFIKSAFEGIGGELSFWKIAVKPGKPFIFGRWRQGFLFGLPGNPVSALVTFLLLVRPALRQWQRAAEVGLPFARGEAAEPLRNSGDRRHFLRVHLDLTGKVRSSGKQASHVLSSLAAANGLVDVPPQTTIEAGQPVTVLLWG